VKVPPVSKPAMVPSVLIAGAFLLDETSG